MLNIGLCEGGCPSVISERVDEWQRDNWSVYAPHDAFAACWSAPERLRWRCPTSEEHESAEGGCGVPEIRETVIRGARPRGVGLARGVPRWQESFRAVVLGSDEALRRGVRGGWKLFEEAPRKLDAIESLTDAMEITKSPRRFGQHFIDVCWKPATASSGAMAPELTDLGRAMLAELKSAKEA